MLRTLMDSGIVVIEIEQAWTNCVRDADRARLGAEKLGDAPEIIRSTNLQPKGNTMKKL